MLVYYVKKFLINKLNHGISATVCLSNYNEFVGSIPMYLFLNNLDGSPYPMYHKSLTVSQLTLEPSYVRFSVYNGISPRLVKLTMLSASISQLTITSAFLCFFVFFNFR